MTTTALSAAREAVREFFVEMLVSTDVIGGSVYDTKYAVELLTVDLGAEPQDGDLVAVLFGGRKSRPHMARFRRTGRDLNGRFVPSGDPQEGVELSYVVAILPDPHVRVLGRVIGPEREFPRAKPSTYKTADDLRRSAA